MSEALSRAVAAEIRKLMDARGVSAYAIWKATGIPQSSVGRKLRDEAPFDLDDVQKIAAVFDVEPADLIAWAQRHTRSNPME